MSRRLDYEKDQTRRKTQPARPASAKQRRYLEDLCKRRGVEFPDYPLTMTDARSHIDRLKAAARSRDRGTQAGVTAIDLAMGRTKRLGATKIDKVERRMREAER